MSDQEWRPTKMRPQSCVTLPYTALFGWLLTILSTMAQAFSDNLDNLFGLSDTLDNLFGLDERSQTVNEK